MASYGFPRSRRLLTPGDYRQVFDQAVVKAGTAELFLLARSASNPDGPRVGFIISRKNVRRAVARNRIKRVVREHFRHLPADYPSLDIIVMARKGADKLPAETLHDAVQYLFRKLNKRFIGQSAHTSASQ
ncbi:ribonuclease P protein component [Salinispirillum sp. LH 10-3-1]|uniref:Ribonuclease P protein component n=1 Tax=Salinispirillum sp. LH 10-3-1 TaxID=2952525 RepID=A0AB38YFN2_9GAMM